MKKSAMYKLAQRAVLRDERLSEDAQLEIIKELQKNEDTALIEEELKGTKE